MTTIEWTRRPGTKGETWNPVVGCDIVSPGCTHCYAMKRAERIQRMSDGLGRETHYAGTTKPSKAGPVWTGTVNVAPDDVLTKPLRWKSPRTVFVNSMSDLFHEAVPDETIDRIFAVMALTPQNTYQVLTKRSARMQAYITRLHDEPVRDTVRRIVAAWPGQAPVPDEIAIPLPNVWLGVSAERQKEADERIPDLLTTPAAIRFVSAEPLLEAIDFARIGTLDAIRAAFPSMVERIEQDSRPSIVSGMQIDVVSGRNQATIFHQTPDHTGGFTIRFPRPFPRLDQIIVGGESGPDARPMHPAWARQIRDQCAAAGTAFFFKQWGAWEPVSETRPDARDWGRDWMLLDNRGVLDIPDDRVPMEDLGEVAVANVGRSRAGRCLDGREHNEWPSALQVPFP